MESITYGKKLGEYFGIRYMDGNQKREKDGRFFSNMVTDYQGCPTSSNPTKILLFDSKTTLYRPYVKG